MHPIKRLSRTYTGPDCISCVCPVYMYPNTPHNAPYYNSTPPPPPLTHFPNYPHLIYRIVHSQVSSVFRVSSLWGGD